MPLRLLRLSDLSRGHGQIIMRIAIRRIAFQHGLEMLARLVVQRAFKRQQPQPQMRRGVMTVFGERGFISLPRVRIDRRAIGCLEKRRDGFRTREGVSRNFQRAAREAHGGVFIGIGHGCDS